MLTDTKHETRRAVQRIEKCSQLHVDKRIDKHSGPHAPLPDPQCHRAML